MLNLTSLMLLAQNTPPIKVNVPTGTGGTGGTAGTSGAVTNPTGSIPGLQILTGNGTLQDFVARLITALLIVAGAVAVIFLISGGISYITAGGDPGKADKGKTTIVNAIIGIVIIFLAIMIVQWVKSALASGRV